jgi:hypothetical protein
MTGRQSLTGRFLETRKISFSCQKSNHGSSIVFSHSLAAVATGFEQLFQTMAG